METRTFQFLTQSYPDSQSLLFSMRTNISTGINSETIDERKEVYGENILPPPIMKSFLQFLWEAMKEPMVVLLLIAAGTTVAVGIYETITGKTNAWLEGVAILIAIAIITGVNSINDHRKQARFRKLNDTNKSLRTVKIIRDDHVMQVQTKDLLVGDIVAVTMGDILSCDGIPITENAVKTDESSITGESRQIEKTGFANMQGQSDASLDPFVVSGTIVVNGNGKLVVVLVGERSMEGKMMRDVRIDPPPTPLQEKLAHLAKRLATIGLVVAVITLIFLVVIYFLKGSPGNILDGLIAVVLIGISIIVMAIPEGLPLAVTLALAYATIHMLKDNNLVRHLNACETMGGATTVCSDKTGTLTINKMTVVRAKVFDISYDMKTDDAFKRREDMQRNPTFREFAEGIMVNTDAYEAEVAGRTKFLGSQTEIALLEWLKLVSNVTDYETARKSARISATLPFNSERKRSSVTVDHDGSKTTFVKGASEVILGLCNTYIDANGREKPLDETVRRSFEGQISDYARLSLRTVCCAFKRGDDIRASRSSNEPGIPDEDDHQQQQQQQQYTLYGVFGLEDPLRSNARDSVEKCQRAGIVVRMVTGDNAFTARSIARQCGIIQTEEDVVLEGPQFRAMSEEDIQQLLPNLRVMARSSPNDKLLLVNALIKARETVAVTGDGANDAPALKSSHVGFSMGISGTEVAKEASDIVLLDDNFASIVRAILWGRAIYMGIQKFIMFQLSVNVSAVIITIVTAVDTSLRTGIAIGGLTTLQILLLNLIADSLPL